MLCGALNSIATLLCVVSVFVPFVLLCVCVCVCVGLCVCVFVCCVLCCGDRFRPAWAVWLLESNKLADTPFLQVKHSKRVAVVCLIVAMQHILVIRTMMPAQLYIYICIYIHLSPFSVLLEVVVFHLGF